MTAVPLLPAAPDPISSAQSLVRVLSGWAEDQAEVVAAYLFGSVAHGSARPDSDVDVALLVRSEALPRIRAERRHGYEMDAAAALSRALGGTTVDVVILNEAPTVLARRAVFDGKLAFSRDERARIAHATHVQARYLRAAPLRALRRDYLRRHFGGTPA